MKKVYIGIDAHKETNSMASAFAGREKPETIGKYSADLDRFIAGLRKFQKKQDLKKDEISLCYEAGPTGFVLARRLIKLGYDCIVVAPSLIPQKSGDKVKTDRRDARKLAGLLRAGELTAVHIPDVADEVIRDVCRGRTDAVSELMRCKKQLLSFLLRNGYRYSGTARWTQAHMRYLRELVLPHPAQKLILEEYIQRIDTTLLQIARIEDQMDLLLTTWSRRPFVEALMGFRGFQRTAAMVLISEIGDFKRFDHPKKLMAYLGLVPTEDSSGGKRRQGGITKCGNSHARWMLVECAGHYRMPPKISKALSKRQEGLSREIRAVSWHAQNRLNKRWFKLTMRGVHFNKIRVSIARELSSYLWDLGHIVD
ncbi:MAG: IS110 family transposase [Verrucomicrobia bacterium]|nr:IS110 family transposase [Verrucomicrobiota bacterium]